MNYNLSWQSRDKVETFTTECPKMAEIMMRATTDFPPITAEMRTAFENHYGRTRGSFEQLLREQSKASSHVDGIKTAIPGLTVRIHN